MHNGWPAFLNAGPKKKNPKEKLISQSQNSHRLLISCLKGDLAHIRFLTGDFS